MRLAGMASATVSKFAIAVPPRFLISSTTSSAGAALVPEPSAATPGSLTTTLAPSVAQSSAISRPMPRPAPVTMMTLSCSDLAMGCSRLIDPLLLTSPRVRGEVGAHRRCNPGEGDSQRVRMCGSGPPPQPSPREERGEGAEGVPLVTGCSLLVRKNDRATCREHAADAMADRDFGVLDLRRRNAAHLPHALLQRVHAVHAGMHVAQAAAIGVERQLAARPGAVGDEFAGLFMRHEAEIAEAVEWQMREGVVDHEVIDVLVSDAGFLERERARHLEGARTVKRLHLANHRRFHAFAGAEDIDRLSRKVFGAVGRGEDQRAAAVGDEAALQQAERVGDHA